MAVVTLMHQKNARVHMRQAAARTGGGGQSSSESESGSDECVHFGFGLLGIVLLVLAVGSLVAFVLDNAEYSSQIEAGCNDANGTSVEKIIGNQRRPRHWTCSVQVQAKTKDDGDFIKWRDAGTIGSEQEINDGTYANRDQVTPVCRTRFRTGTYTCYIAEDRKQLFPDKNNFPTLLLISTIVCWTLLGLSCLSCCCYRLLAGSTSVKSSQGKDPTPLFATKPKVKADQVAVDPSDEENALQQAAAECRKLVIDDLCPELIPGLYLRVLCFGRWHSAYAANYSIEEETVTVVFSDRTIIAKYLNARRNVHSIQDPCTLRLHEKALAQRARQKILDGVLRAYLSGATFQALDSDGNGKLSEAEIVEGFQKHGVTMGRADIRSLLLKLDKNHDGKVDAKEFRTFLANGFNLEEGRKKDSSEYHE